MTVRSVFVDTNVLVYCVDRAEPAKGERALAVVDYVTSRKAGAISPQVVSEFVSAVRRLHAPLGREQIESVLAPTLLAFDMLPVDETVVRETLRCWRRYSISYWDAQIWATARIGGVDTILTEDCVLREIEGVRYVNPFVDGFEAVELGLPD